jgi:glycine cleavage system H protein
MEYKVIEGLYYTKGDEWIKVENGVGAVGITDYAQDKLGDVVYVEEVHVGKKVEKDDVVLTVESVKAASDINAPVSGEIVEVNAVPVKDSSIINKDPYGEGWLFKVRLDKPEELKELMDAKAYTEYRKE